MAIGRIRKIVEPHKQNRDFYGGVYKVFLEGLPTAVPMFKTQVDLLKFENEMLLSFPEEVIEKHRDLVIEHVQDEQARDGESE